MKQLTGINIRKGLEIEIPIKDIFKPNIQNSGDKRAKSIYENHFFKNENDDIIKELIKNEFFEYYEFLSDAQIGKSLSVSIFNNFKITHTKFQKERIVSECNPNLTFYNTEKLSFADFCFNLMSAQAFSGNFKTNLTHQFTGIGDFEIEMAAQIFPLAIAGNLSLDYFFIYYKGILTTIPNLISAQFEKDLKQQKSYLENKEYRNLLNELKEHQELISEIINNI